MKKLLTTLFVCLTILTYAQPNNPNPSPVPVDGGLVALAASGVAYAMYRKNKKK